MSKWSLLGRKRVRYGIAFGEQFLLAARLGAGKRGGSIETARQDFPPGFFSVSSVDPNFGAVSLLARLAGDGLAKLGCPGGPVAMVLPDLAVRSFVFTDGKNLTPQELLSRMAPRLSYPSQEAVVDTWQAAPGWVLVATVRRAVLQQYEQALEALGCHAAWVDGASMTRVPIWTAEAIEDPSRGLRIHVQLYPRHYSLVVFRQSELLDVRTRLRHPADWQRVVEDVVRAPTHYELDECCQLTVRGEGAAAVVQELEEMDLNRGRIELEEDGEEAHLRSLVEILMCRMS